MQQELDEVQAENALLSSTIVEMSRREAGLHTVYRTLTQKYETLKVRRSRRVPDSPARVQPW